MDADKTSNTIQHSFMTKTLNKLDIEGMYLNIINAIYDKPITYIIPKSERLKTFPLRSETRQE